MLKQKLFRSFALCTIAFSTISYAQDVDYNIPIPQLNAQTFILMDYHSGAVLAGFNPDQRQYPASLTKMMTSYVVGDALKTGKIRNDDLVTVTENSWGKNFPGSSKMFLNLNQQVSVDDLNRGIIIVSGNDASVAIAEHISGSQQAFIDTMNHYVQKFGLKNTHFATVHGLDDPNQYTSARDMAIIGSHLIRDLPDEYKIYAEKEFTFNKIKQPNRNGLLWDKSINVDGMKTGHTDKAGYNLVASAYNSNTRLISVVMGVPTYKGREVESKKLLQWGFANFETLKPLSAGQNVVEQDVYFGELNKTQLGTLQDSFITIPKGKSQEIKMHYVLEKKNLEAPLVKGQVVGKMVYQLGEKQIANVDLQVMQDVPEAGMFGKAWDWIVLTIKGIFE
ncbi:D-alanyl-D-alanine carboxypeptidase (penicillin-binding protein 5/6) [Nicoletella semolina]|uniref:serine-type D-Ala-D-Ala carboxypeptidase n=1 Tax=Nicoletella semolina TaxID=271160 RepID=A0A4V2SJV2_9PAST|nr:serine hydrolase [Nicoletella semolina]MDH2924670.1 D-alanyl-D-alanine carboxypeptidase [Nicoletella semolina]TCP17036.1 D-alanyl-D-alanine carboxypeptidase (penicillin-binding protein 5/6) [Nicoletella semolina]